MEALFLLVSQLAMSAQHDLQMPRQVFFSEQLRHAFDALAFVARYLQQGRVFARNFGDGRIAQEPHHLPREVSWTVAFADEMVNLPQHFVACAPSDRLHHFLENVRGCGPHKITHRIRRDPSRRGCNRLVENRQRIAHGAVPGFGQEGESIVIGLDLFASHKIAQLSHDVVKLHRPETEVLAARANGLRDVFRLRRRQHEYDVIRRLFQSLEQSVEGGVGNLVSFVENVNLEAIARWTVARRLAQFADLIDAAVRSSVNLDHVDGIARANLRAGLADSARLRHRLVGRAAIQRCR